VRAADAIEKLGIHGRSYNTFSAGGYLIYRFWPNKDRLPFMDIHQAGTTDIRRLYTFSLERPQYWAELDSKYSFEWALLIRRTFATNHLPDFLDADTTWALVFQDDIAMVLVRRTGPMAEVASRNGYRILPAGNERLAAIGEACAQNPDLRQTMRAELERVIAESDRHANAEELLANLALMDGRREEAAEHLRRALAIEPHDAIRLQMLREIEGR
jgi:tetratricopeptide (TPR) repeat protein